MRYKPISRSDLMFRTGDFLDFARGKQQISRVAISAGSPGAHYARIDHCLDDKDKSSPALAPKTMFGTQQKEEHDRIGATCTGAQKRTDLFGITSASRPVAQSWSDFVQSQILQDTGHDFGHCIRVHRLFTTRAQIFIPDAGGCERRIDVDDVALTGQTDQIVVQTKLSALATKFRLAIAGRAAGGAVK